ncbi:hypothetical protein BSUBE1_2803 [Bacillus subtilis E1]|nr:hypothetical protein BSUBE1_2803 [Bacillus subtilis E1]
MRLENKKEARPASYSVDFVSSQAQGPRGSFYIVKRKNPLFFF